jgi:roadblock/LC7 domain-containing protein
LNEYRWRSAQIEVAIGLEGMLASIYTPDGRRILREGEIEEEQARLCEEMARKDAELERLRRLLDER